MSFRTEPMWIQRKTKHLLWTVRSIYPMAAMTPDELLDDMVMFAIKEKYPEALACLKAQQEVEERFAQDIRAEKAEA